MPLDVVFMGTSAAHGEDMSISSSMAGFSGVIGSGATG
jgi:hypothetical protein